MSSIRDRLRRLNRPHAAEGVAEPVDEAERLQELERIIAADTARAAVVAPRTADSAPSSRAAEPVVAPPSRAPSAAAEAEAVGNGASRPSSSRVARASTTADDGPRFVPLDELDPSDNRLRRRKSEPTASRREPIEALPERTTIGKDASFLSLVSSRRFDAWKQRQAGSLDVGEPPAPRSIEYVADREPPSSQARSPLVRTTPRSSDRRGLPRPLSEPSAVAHATAPSVAVDSPPSRVASGPTEARSGPAVHLAQALDGRWICGAHGPCFAAFERVDSASLFGSVRVGEPFDLPASTWHHLGGESLSRLEDLVFLDLETTGTEPSRDLAFVIGVGRASREGFEVEQIAVHHPGEEVAALGALLERLRGVRGVVTFNGQRFDMRFLRTRFARHGLDVAPLELAHFDLYLLARKAWGRQQPRYRLIDLEQNVLGFGRVDDVPGAEAPRRYARYRQSGDISLIVPVFEHNRHDIVAMFPLLGRIASQMASRG